MPSGGDRDPVGVVADGDRATRDQFLVSSLSAVNPVADWVVNPDPLRAYGAGTNLGGRRPGGRADAEPRKGSGRIRLVARLARRAGRRRAPAHDQSAWP